MLRFQYPDLLAALALLPVLAAIFIGMLYWRRKKIKQIGTPNVVQEQMLGFIPMRQSLKFILLSSALLFLIIGAANLQKSGNNETIQRKGVDVMIALDVSKSMLAKDIQPDRLTRAKQFISRLSDKMSSDRIGLVIFAGRSYVQVPLTVDYSALKFLLQTVSPDMVPTQGTVIGDAIAMANKSFSSKERKFKSIIVISDGEDHDATALEAVKKASEEGVIIHTIGIGSPQGATLFDPNTNAPKLGEQGNPVVSKLNETELKNIAAAGNGSYTLLGNTETAANQMIENLSGMEQRNLGAVVYTNYTSYFQYFLLVAFVLIVIEWLIAGARKTQASNTTKIGVKSISILLFAIGISGNASAQSALKKGNQLYDAGKYKEAANEYGKAIKEDSAQLQKSTYNLGNALYQQKQIDNARKAYDVAAQKAKNVTEKANAQYNTGNTYMSERKWEDAIEAYKKTLRNNPQDQDAKYNLSYAKAMLQKEQQNKKKQNKKDDKKDDKKKEDKKKEEQQNKQGQQNKNEQGQEQQQQQGQESKLSQQQAEQLLNALQQEEKKLQEQKKKMHGAPTRMAKDW